MALIDDHQSVPLEERRMVFDASETGKHRNVEFLGMPPGADAARQRREGELDAVEW